MSSEPEDLRPEGNRALLSIDETTKLPPAPTVEALRDALIGDDALAAAISAYLVDHPIDGLTFYNAGTWDGTGGSYGAGAVVLWNGVYWYANATVSASLRPDISSVWTQFFTAVAPAGGTPGQVLTKYAVDDYATAWETIPTSHMHDQPTASTLWTINHNLGYRPGGITVIDTAGAQWDGFVHYVDENTLTISFNSAFAGTAYLS